MVGRTPAMAKFARPNTKGVLLRENLFKTLNEYRTTPVVWVQSPAGAGKTTLISSYLDTYGIPCLWYQMDEADADPASFFYYLRQAVLYFKTGDKKELKLPLLTPEYLANLPRFTRRFFERLFEELNQDRILVFDNYQTISERTVFHKVFFNGLAVIPPGKQVIVISREAPPGIFARFKVNDDMVVLTWDQLQLSLEESRQVVDLKGYRHLSEDQINEIYKKCEGWVAGLMLILKMEESGGVGRVFHTTKCFSDDIFNYFAGEVFERMEPEIQNLLLKTAYLPKVHAHHAVCLTGNPQAETLLWSLSVKQYFVTSYSDNEPVFRYHQLFRQYQLPEGPTEARVTSGIFCAFMYRQPQHPDISLWEERVKQMILNAKDARLKIMLSTHLMLYYCWWAGGQEKAAFLVEVLQSALKDKKVAPLHYIVWRSMEGASLWMRNCFSQSQVALSDGLEYAAKTGIRLWDFMLLANMVYVHLCQHQLERADCCLHKMQFILKTHRDMDISHYHSLCAYAQLCKCNIIHALEHIDAAIEFADRTGCPFLYHFYLIEKADVLIEAGNYDQADGLLKTAFEFGQHMRSSNLTYQASWLCISQQPVFW